MARIHKVPEVSINRFICNRYEAASELEWLVTNGIGGYAAGTVAGSLTRRYHGLLLAALNPPLQRTVLLSKLDETVRYLGESTPLFVNHWASGVIEPTGHHHLERFHLEGAVPVWSFEIRDALLQKRIWMEPGRNTTYVRYDNLRSMQPMAISMDVFLNFRDHHTNTRAGSVSFDLIEREGGFEAGVGGLQFFISAPGAKISLDPVWASGYFLKIEAFRGLHPLEDLFRGASLEVSLNPGDSFAVIASTEKNPERDSTRSYAVRRKYELDLLSSARALKGVKAGETAVQQLVLAADQFVAARPSPEDLDGRTIIAGYPWFADWGRDTMISLSGLTLATGRSGIARKILVTFARYVDQGMLPNRFPDDGEPPEYNTLDATLWYFEAVRAYLAQTGDIKLLESLYETLKAIIQWHLEGTRYGIRVDPVDGLLRAGEPGVQLTWMDVKIGDWVVTPRIGKPVEINALWYNALVSMAEFAALLDEDPAEYQDMASRVQQGFDRYWIEGFNYCYDVLDGPEGDDRSLRPNQLFAVSLPFSPLAPTRQKAIVDRCASELYASNGLRSLASGEQAFTGVYGGGQCERDAAYHQGTSWGWLIGPFLAAHWRVYQDRSKVIGYLQPLLANLHSHGLGNLSEIFEGNAPFLPRGCFAQAWTVAEVLRIWELIHKGTAI